MLEALQHRTLVWADVQRAAHEGRLDHVFDAYLLAKPLATVMAEVVGQPTATHVRYRTSLSALWERGVLPASAPWRALLAVDWPAVYAQWHRSGSDWNNLRRALSRCCTLLFQDKSHPFRGQLMHRMPIAREVKRRPTLTREDAARLVAALTPPAQTVALGFLAFGFRKWELFQLRPGDLEAGRLAVRGTKTAASDRVVPVPAALQTLAEALCPPPLTVHQFRREWRRARVVIGQPTLRVHDLRRICAQWLTEAGVEPVRFRELLGHRSATMTMDYATGPAGLLVAGAMAEVMRPLLEATP